MQSMIFLKSSPNSARLQWAVDLQPSVEPLKLIK